MGPLPTDARSMLLALVCALALTILADVATAEAERSHELHPQWSPDARKLVFESNRRGNPDIYTLNLDTGAVRRLTVAAADDARPVWSRDGRWIAFHSDRSGSQDLYMVRPDGTDLRRLTDSDLDETNASWSPSSSEIVFERRIDQETWHLFILDTTSLEERPLLARPGSHLTPSWTGSGAIAFSYSPAGGNHDTDLVLLTIDPASGTIEELLSGRRGNSNIDSSAATGRVVFNSIRDGDWEIYTSTPSGDDELRLTTNGGEGLEAIDGQPAWSPSGDRIAITSGREESLDIFILSTAGSEAANLTADWLQDDPGRADEPIRRRGHHSMSDPAWSAQGIPGSDSPPVWSRDGSEILFQQTREEGLAQIWAIRPDGSGLRRLTDGSFRAGHPDPCPIDDRLALVSDRDGSRQVWVMSLDSGDLDQITTGGAPKSWPAFSPDCREILFVEMSDPAAGRYDLRVVDLGTGAIWSLLGGVRHLGWPRWTPDGEWALFHREIEGYPNHLWRVHPDGTGATPLSSGDQGDYWAPDVSRDGRLMTYSFSRREQLQWGGNADLWLIDLESRRCRRLADGPWHEHGQRLSPDGRLLAYWDGRTGYNELFVIELQDGTSSQLTFQPPAELTRLARERGVTSALDHARTRPAEEELASETAIATLLESRADRAEEPSLELARLFVERLPTSSRASASLARELFRSGELRAARDRYRALWRDDPADARIAARLAALTLIEETAGRPLDQLESEGLAEAEVNRLGYALLRMGQTAEATDVLAWNVRYHPSSANVWDSLGEALYWSGELTAAERHYSRARELDPTNENAARFLKRIESVTDAKPTDPVVPSCPLPPDG